MAGPGTLTSLGLLQAAQRSIDSTLAGPVAGPIFTGLPVGSYLSLGQVVRLHTTNPELFACVGDLTGPPGGPGHRPCS